MLTNHDCVLIVDNLLRLLDFGVITQDDFVEKVVLIVWDLDNELQREKRQK